jgi:hypothetical protein
MNKKEKELVQELLTAIDRNITSLWVSDLSETEDCIILDTTEITEDPDTEDVTYYTGVNYAIGQLISYMEKQESIKIKDARETLKTNGYIVDNLFQGCDVTINYECTDEEAYDVASKAIGSEYITSTIFEMIDEYARDEKLKPKTNED